MMSQSNEDLNAVASVYRSVRDSGKAEQPAYLLALAVYRSRHPDEPEDAAARSVEQLIAAAEEQFGPGMQGVEAVIDFD